MKLAASLSLVVALTARGSAAQRPLPSHAAPAAAPAAAVREVARVNGTALTSDRLAAALAALIPQESFHRNVGAERLAALRQQALATIVDEELVYQDAARRGVTATPRERKAAYAQTVARYGGSARFDAALRTAGVTRVSVEREITRRIVIDKHYGRAVTSRCGVSRADAEAFFTNNPGRFVEPERLHVHAITIGVEPSSGGETWRAARARAEQARHAIESGMTFADAARAYSTDPSRNAGGDMGLVHRGSMTEPFEAIVAALPVGVASDVVESLYGYHIVLVSEVKPPQPRTFDDVSGTLMSDLSASRCRERKDTWLAALRAAARIQLTPPAP